MPFSQNFQIAVPDQTLRQALQTKIDEKTKPLGALGKLEALALQIGLVQQTLTPHLNNPVCLVFAGDHGITEAGVSPYPQQVTHQMVLNFLAGGAAINVFARQHGFALRVVDAGVNADINPHPALINAKIAKGTNNFLHTAAMTAQQCQQALQAGCQLAQAEIANGSNVLSFGEMGIGNTSSATALVSCLTGLSVSDCVGRGTGLDNAGLLHKQAVIEQALAEHQLSADQPLNVLATLGGFEIAMMTGAMLGAAQQNALILIDGFIASSAYLVASKLAPAIQHYAIFAHRSDEAGHSRLLAYLQAQPLLDLGMRLGEGTGTAVAYPIIQSAVDFLNEMASFNSAGVSQRAD